MKVLINEQQLNYLLFEGQGYVDIFDDITEYLYDIVTSYVSKTFGLKDNYTSIIQNLPNQYENNEILDIIKLNEKVLSYFDISFTKEIIISLIYSNNSYGGFAINSVEIDDDIKNNKVKSFKIILNIVSYLENKKEFYETVLHELTHAYETCQTIIKNSGDSSNKNTPNKILRNKQRNTELVNNITDESVYNILYLMSKEEANANVSALYAVLQASNANRNNYKEIVKSSNIYLTLKNLDKLIEYINNNTYNIVDTLYNFSKKSDYADLLPSSKNLNISRFKKRLIRAINYKKENLTKRINKVINAYLQKKIPE